MKGQSGWLENFPMGSIFRRVNDVSLVIIRIRYEIRVPKNIIDGQIKISYLMSYLMTMKRNFALSHLREITGMSQSSLAALCEKSVHTIQSIEQGKLSLSAELADRIGFETGVSPAWLIIGSNEEPPKCGVGELLGQPYTREVFDRVRANAVNWAPTSEEIESTYADAILGQVGLRLKPVLMAAAKSKQGVPILVSEILNFVAACAEKYGTVDATKHLQEQFFQIYSAQLHLTGESLMKEHKDDPGLAERLKRVDVVIKEAKESLKKADVEWWRPEYDEPIRDQLVRGSGKKKGFLGFGRKGWS